MQGDLRPDRFGDGEGTRSGYKMVPVALPSGMDPDECIKDRGIDFVKSLIKKNLLRMRNRQCQLTSIL